LKKEGLEKDTMIVFCSDNGPVGDDGYADEALEKMGDHRAAGPYSGGKYSIFEGGTRTPSSLTGPEPLNREFQMKWSAPLILPEVLPIIWESNYPRMPASTASM